MHKTMITVALPDLGDNDVYAPMYANGTEVVFVRTSLEGLATGIVNNDFKNTYKDICSPELLELTERRINVIDYNTSGDFIGVSTKICAELGLDQDTDTAIVITKGDKK